MELLKNGYIPHWSIAEDMYRTLAWFSDGPGRSCHARECEPKTEMLRDISNVFHWLPNKSILSDHHVTRYRFFAHVFFLILPCWKLTNNEFKESMVPCRFQKDDLPRLLDALEIPECYICSQRTNASGMEALMILLRRLSYPNRWCDLVPIFGRSESELSLIFTKVIYCNKRDISLFCYCFMTCNNSD